MTPPEQPTPEATSLADELWWILGSRGGDARQGAIRDAADRIDRFAAQRAAEAVAELRCAACDGHYPNPDCPHLRNARDMGERIPCVPARAPTPPPGDAGERARTVWNELRTVVADPRGQSYAGFEELSIGIIAAALQSERTAAASQARRETIEECAHFVESGIFLSDSSPAYQFAHECAAAIRRALATPQESAS